MVIIGFDPGLTNTGYAVLRKKNNEITMVECGLISPKKGKEVSERLYTIFFETNNLIKKFKPESFKKGNIKNLNGEVIGVHDGIVNFTIGQRKGIKVADKEALYVIKIDAKNNEIIVGGREHLGKKKINLKNINLLSDHNELSEDVLVKVRSTGKLLDAKVNLLNQNEAEVNLNKPEDGISPGQACVFYKKDQFGDKVLGGGWIK